MELSTAIAIGILKAIAMIMGGILALAFLGVFLKFLSDSTVELFSGLKDLARWIVRKWKWLLAYVSAFTISNYLANTPYEIIGTILNLALILFSLGYYLFWKNQIEIQTRKDAENFASGTEKHESSPMPASQLYSDEKFTDFIKRNKFIIFFIIAFIAIANFF